MRRSTGLEKHLAAIREKFPVIEGATYCPKWVVSELIVDDFKVSANDCIESIKNSEYGPVSSREFMDLNFKIFRFEMYFNPEKLAPIISQLCNASARPNGITCIDGDTLQLDVLSETESKYTFSKGYGDCPSGCMYSHYWQFSVTSDGVTVANEWEVGEKSL